MPVINFDYNDLCSMLGEKVPRKTLIERIPMIGADMHDTEGEVDEMSVEFFPDRPDLYSAEGLARGMRAFLDIEPGIKEYDVEDTDIDIFVDDSVKNVRPCFRCAVVFDVPVDDNILKSIMAVQEKLHITIGRKRSKLAIGVHDLDKITPPFTYKAVGPHDIKFVPLAKTEKWDLDEILQKHEKGVDYAHLLKGFKKYPIITDVNGEVLSFPPIINGALTTVTTETRNLFIDVTGNDMKAVKCALDILVTAMAERGGNIGSVTMHDNGETFISPDLSSTSWDFSIKGCEKFLGVELGAETITDALRRMGFDALAEGDTMYVEVPSTRVDIMHKVDLYEDVATGYGFEKFGSKHPVTQTSGRISDVTSFSEIIRDLMIGMGFTEAMTLTLSSQKDEFELSKLPEKNVVTVLNPITEEHTCLRSSLMPSLMRILRRNKHRDLPQRLFEVGDVVVDSKKERHICGVVMHSKTSFTEVKSYAESVLRELKAEYTLRSSNYNTFIGGRGAYIIVEGDVIGYFGEISPEVITDFEITHPVIMFEINLQPFIKKMAGKLF
ncbi:MAG: phenylalanine--tRNA ligase subunit beta [Candidatus Methanomethylophilaceae archaeon]